MPQIPDASQLGARSIPQSSRGVVSFDGGIGARAMAQTGQDIQQFGAKLDIKAQQEKDAQDKLNKANAILELKKVDLQHEEYMKANPQDYLKFDEMRKKAWAEAVPKVKKDFGINDPLFDVVLSEDYINGQSRVSTYADARRKEFVVADDIATQQTLKAAYNQDTPIEQVQRDVALKKEKKAANIATYGADGVARGNIEDENDLYDTWLSGLPTKKAVEYLKAPVANFNADTVKPYDAKRITSIRDMVAKPSEYDALFEEMGAKYGVDPKELKLRAAVESGLNPTAQAKATPYGQSGGLMQLEVGTAKRLGVTDRNDPRQSVEGAAKLLAQHQKKAGGDQEMVDKLYYAGSEKMMGKNTEQYAANLAAVRGAGSNPYKIPPDVVQKWRPRIEAQANQDARQAHADALASLENQIPVDTSYLDDLSDPAEQAELKSQLVVAEKIGQVKSIPFSEGEATLKAMEVTEKTPVDQRAEAQKNYDAYKAALTQDQQKWLGEDNAAYAIASSKELQNLSEDAKYTPMLMEEMERVYDQKGVPESKRNYVTKAQGEALAENINTQMAQREDKLSYLREMQAMYGNKWPKVAKQIAPKLSDAINTAISYDSRNPAVAIITANNAAKTNDELALGVQPTTDIKKVSVDAVKPVINEKMRSLEESLLATDQMNGSKTFDSISEQAARLALHYAQVERKDLDTAIDMAATEMTKYYDFGTTGKGNVFRVPAGQGYDIAKIQRSAREYVAYLRPEDIKSMISLDGIPERMHDDLVDAFKYGSYWVTNRTDDGMVLVAEGFPIKDKNGNSIEKTFEEMMNFELPDYVLSAKDARSLAIQRNYELRRKLEKRPGEK